MVRSEPYLSEGFLYFCSGDQRFSFSVAATPSAMSVAYIFASVGFLYGLYHFLKSRSAGRLPLPPGPKGVPFFGNFFQFSPTEIEIQYQKLGAEYGPSFFSREWFSNLIFLEWTFAGEIIHLSNMGHPIIVLNSEKVVKELANKRSAIYSDRPRFVMYGELCVLGPVVTPVDNWD
jgi:hypothetical protein